MELTLRLAGSLSSAVLLAMAFAQVETASDNGSRAHTWPRAASLLFAMKFDTSEFLF